jgi:hypothetical protein
VTKQALCIGINDYPGTGSDLRGCVNDANDWAEALSARGYDVTVMLDEQATRDAMLAAIERTTGIQAGTAVITYSGHGSFVPDVDGDEPDRRDEVLCPYDITRVGPLSDDALYDIFLAAGPGVRVVLISDSCHSGTVSRLAPPVGDSPHRVRFLPPETFLSGEQLAAAARVAGVVAPRQALPHAGLLLPGCLDTEYSYDASFDGRPNGAFTYFALATLKELPADATYRDWVREIRGHLPSQSYPQTPGLQGSRRMRSWGVLEEGQEAPLAGRPAPA